MTPTTIKVLVVEDEALVRMGIVDALEDEGFEVLEAASAEEAIEILIARLDINAVFTDIDMPHGMDGLRLAVTIRDRWPPIKIIVTSGHRYVDTDDLPVEGRFFPKPYNSVKVARALREMVAIN